MSTVAPERRTTKVIRKSLRPGQEPWEQRVNGLTWEDMPTCGGYEHKLLDFALYRRGRYDPEIDQAVDAEDDDEEEVKARRRTMAQRNYSITGGSGRMRVAMLLAQRSRDEMAARAADLAQRAERQQALLARYVAAKRQGGFVRAIYDADVTAHSAIIRALGRGRGCKGPLRAISLDRIERVFAKLNQEGWVV